MGGWLRGLSRLALGLVGIVAMLALVGYLYERYAEARDTKLFPAPGKLVDVGGRRLHLFCEGPTGGPTTVMVAGGGTPSVASYRAQALIARFARVCSYDRAGLGWSDAASHPLSLADQVTDLERVLDRGHVPTPYVFVPESFGGLISLGFAARHREKVAGAVFVDSVDSPLWFGAMDAIEKNHGAFNPNFLELGRRFGVLRLAIPYLAPDWTRTLPMSERDQLFAVFAYPNPGMGEAVDVFHRTAAADRPQLDAGAFGDRPVLVIRHGRNTSEISPEFQSGWTAAQFRLAALSTRSSLIVATKNTHEIAQENPELVADCVRRLIGEIRSRQ